MKRIATIIALITLSSVIQAQDIHHIDLGAKVLTLDYYDSYSQKILSVLEDTDSLKLVRIATFNEWEDSLALAHFSNDPYVPGKDYPDSIKQYLLPTRMINSDSETTRHVAEKIFDGKEHTNMTKILPQKSVMENYSASPPTLQLSQGRALAEKPRMCLSL